MTIAESFCNTVHAYQRGWLTKPQLLKRISDLFTNPSVADADVTAAGWVRICTLFLRAHKGTAQANEFLACIWAEIMRAGIEMREPMSREEWAELQRYEVQMNGVLQG